jgi:uncharacterized protein (TIGR02300 family)
MPELGTKYDCYNCGTKFYDLGKPEPLCPKCGANQKDVERSESTAASSAARKRRKVEIPKALEVEEEEGGPIDDLPIDEEVTPEGIDDEDLADDAEEEIDDEE